MITSPVFAGRRYAVLGLARSGLATLDALVASAASCIAWDSREDARAAVADRATLGDPMEIDLSGLDGLVLSPGVPLNTHPVAARARAAGVPILGDIELFAQARPSLPPHRVVGITGTNGKSTTTALVHHLCREAGLPTLMGGNIGLPILSQSPLVANAAGLPVYVLELSSFQIDLTQGLGCDVAALINISPDHLDRYADFAAYAAAKERLFGMQRPDQAAVIATDDANTQAIADRLAAAGRAVTRVSRDSVDTAEQLGWPTLQGPHNAQNIAVALGIAEALGIDPVTARAALSTYPGLAHRMERVAEHRGVLFVNDSKATNPDSAAPALAAYPRVHWIVGGLPKGDDLDACAPWFGHVVHAYTIGEAGPRFAQLLAPHMPVTPAEMLGEAVRAAMVRAQPGEVVLLSPACASYDQFRDFEARGDCFRQVVAALIAGDTGDGGDGAGAGADRAGG